MSPSSLSFLATSATLQQHKNHKTYRNLSKENLAYFLLTPPSRTCCSTRVINLTNVLSIKTLHKRKNNEKDKEKSSVINHDVKKCSFIIALKASSFLIGWGRIQNIYMEIVTWKVEVLKTIRFSQKLFYYENKCLFDKEQRLMLKTFSRHF